MIIYRTLEGVKTILYDLEVDSQTELKQSISGEDVILFRYVSEQVKLDLQIGDFVEFKESVYTILDEPNVKKSQNTFTYNLQFKSDQYILKNVQVMLDSESEFSLFGNAIDMVSLILSNMNRIYLDGLYYADYIEQTEPKLITFNNENCLAALQRIASEFECEFVIKGKQITFRKKIGVERDLVFRYKKELRDIERQSLQNAELLTVLYPYGSNRNITNEYGSRRLKIAPLERNTEVFGTIERSITFEDIYPRFRGSVASLVNDSTFTDTGIDFNINNQLIGGVKAKVIFNTGDLAGREFEIGSYNHTAKKVELLYYTDDTGLKLPNDTFKPRIGDTYVFVGIKMPQSYIDNAEEELREKATEYIEKYSQPNVIYKVSPHHPNLRENQTDLNIGDVITLQDADFGIEFQTRILSLTQKINNEFEYSIDLGNQVTMGYMSQVLNNQRDIRNNIYQNNRYWTEQFNRVFNNINDFNQAVYVNMGAFSPTEYYHNNQNRRDYIYLINQSGVKEWFYFIGEDHTRGEFIQANWQFIGDNFDIIATQTILAENANIGNWIIQNGQIVSQAIYESTDETEIEPRAQLNGTDGIIKLVSPVDIYGAPGYRTYKQVIYLDSRTGEIDISRTGDSFQEAAKTNLSSNGLSVSFSGIDTQEVEDAPGGFLSASGSQGVGAVVAVGKGKLEAGGRWYFGSFIAGVVGRVVNTLGFNSAPAFGGVFWSLQSFGRSVGVTRTEAVSYSCHKYDELISCYNWARLELKLPEDPVMGRKIEVRRNVGEVRVTAPGRRMIREVVEDNVFLNKGDMWTFIYDGTYWLCNVKVRL